MPLYFAYGSNMDEAAMAGRCPRSKALGAAILHRHRFAIMAEGYASVVRDPHASVYGLLWDVALADVKSLDQYESVDSGLYRKVIQPVKRIDGKAVRPSQQALVYLGRGEGGGIALPGYLENVIACGEQLAFPPAYLNQLQQLATVVSRNHGPGKSGATKPAPKKAPVHAERDDAGEIIVRKRFASPLDR